MQSVKVVQLSPELRIRSVADVQSSIVDGGREGPQPFELDGLAGAVRHQQDVAQGVDHVMQLAFAQAGALHQDLHHLVVLHGGQALEFGAKRPDRVDFFGQFALLSPGIRPGTARIIASFRRKD